jgi:hypothetical protein
LLLLQRCQHCRDDGDNGEDAKDGSSRDSSSGGSASAAGAYYEVEEILDRRIKDHFGSRGTGQAVEYLVQWKTPPPRHLVRRWGVQGQQYNEEDNKQSYVYFGDVRKTLRHPTSRPAILDSYAGVGGMSLGLEKHFDVRWVVDNNHLAAATLRANKAGLDVRIYMEDVKTFLMHSMQQNPCYPSVGKVNHIHASPPCKGFPCANCNKGNIQNNKQTLLFIKAIKHFRPKTATFKKCAGTGAGGCGYRTISEPDASARLGSTCRVA